MRRFRYLVVLFFALIASCSGPISDSDFTKLFIARLIEHDSKLKITKVGPLELEYSKTETEKPYKAYLNNAYQAYMNGDKLTDVIEKYAKSTIQTLATVNLSLENVVPVIKDDAYIEEVTANLKANGSSNQEIDFYSVPYVNGLVIMYAVDTPENIRYINNKDFESLGMQETELRKIAIQNLNRILPQTELHQGKDILMITADGNYESSLLLFDKIWMDLQDKVDGNIVVAIPSRDVLLVTGSSNLAGIAELKKKVEEISANGTYTLTKTLYKKNGNDWIRFDE